MAAYCIWAKIAQANLRMGGCAFRVAHSSRMVLKITSDRSHSDVLCQDRHRRLLSCFDVEHRFVRPNIPRAIDNWGWSIAGSRFKPAAASGGFPPARESFVFRRSRSPPNSRGLGRKQSMLQARASTRFSRSRAALFGFLARSRRRTEECGLSACEMGSSIGVSLAGRQATL